jgi:hypothetical protein
MSIYRNIRSLLVFLLILLVIASELWLVAIQVGEHRQMVFAGLVAMCAAMLLLPVINPQRDRYATLLSLAVAAVLVVNGLLIYDVATHLAMRVFMLEWGAAPLHGPASLEFAEAVMAQSMINLVFGAAIGGLAILAAVLPSRPTTQAAR